MRTPLPRPPLAGLLAVLAVLAVLSMLAGCGGGEEPTATPSAAPSSSGRPAPPATPTTSTTPAAPATPAPADPGTVPPPWLGTRVLPVRADGSVAPQETPPELRHRRFTLPDRLPPLPGTGFAARIASPAPADVIARSTWEPGCPVDRAELAWVRLTFRGFDGARHTGELLVHATAAEPLVTAFRGLWRARFPIEEMRITARPELDLAPTGDGNNTTAFVCRAVRGGTSYSQHAYGLAVDVNPFQNPYEKGTGADRVVLPELATSYLDRGDVRPGMLLADGPAVRAFGAIGWGWGGSWRSLKDYQHLSANGT
ncbi:M15 family metallopeptidase [Nocardioides sp. SYSU D00038]|uniref:M15 family metallopeptidase n=1 Tax=Nocardioides sp. SYSU D00038 TaxID=2812554 RepID=UPI0027DDC5E9|nr:M15 family metallopeptidase [Nocardioides sp. SYSU D00038]